MGIDDDLRYLQIWHSLQYFQNDTDRQCFYLKLAQKFKVLTDHKALKGVQQKDLIQITNVRLKQFFQKIQEYDYEIEYIKGTKNQIADMLSRHPTSLPDEEEVEEECVCQAIMLQRNPLIKENDAVEHMAICRAISAPEKTQIPSYKNSSMLQRMISNTKLWSNDWKSSCTSKKWKKTTTSEEHMV